MKIKYCLQFSSVQFSCSVVSDSLRSHESQHTRPPCPSPTPRVYSNSCPLSWWCHPPISSSVVPFSSCLQCREFRLGDWEQEEKGTIEDEMAGWHHWLDGCEFGWTPGVGDRQRCCNSWGCKESDTIEGLNWTEARNDSDLQRGVSGGVLRRCKPLDVFWGIERTCWQLLCMWDKERSQGPSAWEQKVSVH